MRMRHIIIILINTIWFSSNIICEKLLCWGVTKIVVESILQVVSDVDRGCPYNIGQCWKSLLDRNYDCSSPKNMQFCPIVGASGDPYRNDSGEVFSAVNDMMIDEELLMCKFINIRTICNCPHRLLSFKFWGHHQLYFIIIIYLPIIYTYMKIFTFEIKWNEMKINATFYHLLHLTFFSFRRVHKWLD